MKTFCLVVLICLMSPSVIAQELPFVGKRYFNFGNSTTTTQSIDIKANGDTQVQLHGVYDLFIHYQGKYQNPLKLHYQYNDGFYYYTISKDGKTISHADEQGNIVCPTSGACSTTLYE